MNFYDSKRYHILKDIFIPIISIFVGALTVLGVLHLEKKNSGGSMAAIVTGLLRGKSGFNMSGIETELIQIREERISPILLKIRRLRDKEPVLLP